MAERPSGARPVPQAQSQPQSRLYHQTRPRDGGEHMTHHTKTVFALADATGQGLHITATNQAAQRAGVHPGMTHTDARALVPNLVTRPADPLADARALRTLALWAQRYSPWTRPDTTNAIAIDVTGCAHLFGGELALARDLRQRLHRAHIVARIGVADTMGAARALARFGHTVSRPPNRDHLSHHATDITIAHPGAGLEAVTHLPVEALGAPAETTRLLNRVGLDTVGRVARIPRKALMARLASLPGGDVTLAQLDDVTGRIDIPFAPLVPPPIYQARMHFPEPAICADGLAAQLPALLETVCTQLRRDDRLARRLVVHICRADGGVSRVRVSTARPTCDADHWQRLLRERWERLDPGLGVDAMLVHARAVTTRDTVDRAARPALVAPPADGNAALAQTLRLADRLAARFGEDAVQVQVPNASWIPERAEHMVALVDAPRHHHMFLPPNTAPTKPSHQTEQTAHETRAETGIGTGPNQPARPIRLFCPPEPARVIAALPDGPPAHVTWRNVRHKIVRADGPERITPEWWRDIGAARPADARDYYRVETKEGKRFWVFREGLYDTTPQPSADAPEQADSAGTTQRTTLITAQNGLQGERQDTASQLAAGRPSGQDWGHTVDTQPRWYVHGVFA